MFCLDASFLLNVLFGALTDEHAALWESWQDEGRPMIAPGLLRTETVGTLYWMRSCAQIEEVQLQLTLRALSLMPITYVDDDALDREAIAIAYANEDLTLHGAYYVALASRHGADLWTSDEQLWRDHSWHVPWIYFAPRRKPLTSTQSATVIEP